MQSDPRATVNGLEITFVLTSITLGDHDTPQVSVAQGLRIDVTNHRAQPADLHEIGFDHEGMMVALGYRQGRAPFGAIAFDEAEFMAEGIPAGEYRSLHLGVETLLEAVNVDERPVTVRPYLIAQDGTLVVGLPLDLF